MGLTRADLLESRERIVDVPLASWDGQTVRMRFLPSGEADKHRRAIQGASIKEQVSAMREFVQATLRDEDDNPFSLEEIDTLLEAQQVDVGTEIVAAFLGRHFPSGESRPAPTGSSGTD